MSADLGENLRMVMSKRIISVMAAGLLALAAWAPDGAKAQAVPGDIIRAEVLPGWVQADGTRMAAVRFVLAPGWKTYWRAPGDGGIPPRFDWRGSRNLSGVQFHWPTPQIGQVNGVRTIGYSGELVLPFTLSPKRDGKPVALRAALELGVCEEVCVPVTLNLRADLTGQGASDLRIHEAIAAQPISAKKAGVARVTCEVAPISDGLRLTTRIEMPRLARGETVLFEPGDPSIWTSAPETSRQGRVLTTVTELVPPSAAPFALDRSGVRYTVIAGGQAVDIQGCKGS